MALELDVGLLSTFVDDANVVFQNRGDDRDHVSFHHSSSYAFGTADSNVDDALEGEDPLPALEEIFCIPALFEDADKPFNAAIDR